MMKICFTIEINSICGVGQDTWNLRHKFNYQGPALRILGLRVAIPIPRDLLLGSSWVSVSHVPESRSQDLESQGPVSGLRY